MIKPEINHKKITRNLTSELYTILIKTMGQRKNYNYVRKSFNWLILKLQYELQYEYFKYWPKKDVLNKSFVTERKVNCLNTE